MKSARLSTNFTPYRDTEFKFKAAHIINSMEGNPHFPDPVPTLEQIRLLFDAYETALTFAATMDRMAVAKKNEARKRLAHELARLSLYVMYIADGDEAILTSSGFSFVKTPAPAHLSKPGPVTIKNGINSGQLVSRIKAVPGAKSYVHEIAGSESDPWEPHTSTRRSFTFSNLQPGKHYFIRVAAVGTGTQKAYSPVSDRWAQ